MKFLEKIPYFGKEKSSTETGYKHEEIESIRKPFFSLVEKLKEDIDAETYDVLIGDDASGRIPTVALRNLMAERMRQAHPDMSPEEDREMLKTYFIAGGAIDTNTAKLEEFFAKIKPTVKNRVLFVTEYIASGESVRRIGEMLEEKNIPFDIATLGFAIDERNERAEKDKFFLVRHKIFTGEYTGPKTAPKIYAEYKLAGVKKVPFQESAHAEPYFAGVRYYSRHIESRDDVKKLSDETVAKIWEKQI